MIYGGSMDGIEMSVFERDLPKIVQEGKICCGNLVHASFHIMFLSTTNIYLIF